MNGYGFTNRQRCRNVLSRGGGYTALFLINKKSPVSVQKDESLGFVVPPLFAGISGLNPFQIKTVPCNGRSRLSLGRCICMVPKRAVMPARVQPATWGCIQNPACPRLSSTGGFLLAVQNFYLFPSQSLTIRFMGIAPA